ncbi:MAG: NFACT RNA binding domain-containing protein [Gemmatimonadota bacterium]
MPIRWDALLARHVAAELDAALAGEQLRAIRLDGTSRELLLLFRGHALLWRLHPQHGDVRVLPPVEPVEGDLPLRGTLVGVASLPDDRVVRFQISPSGAGRRRLGVVVELIGNQWNAVVTEAADEGDEGAGAGAGPEVVRHLLWRREAEGTHKVGFPYQAPRPLGRHGVSGDVPLEEWVGALAPFSDEERRAALVKSFAWTSPLNAATLLGVPPGDGEPAALELAHERWTRLAVGEGVAPVVLETAAGPQPYPFPLAGTPHRIVSGLLAAFDEVAREDAPASVGPELMRRLESGARRAARRVRGLERELAELEDPHALRRIGDLILARYHEIPSGAASVSLVDFEGAAVEIELDPKEQPHESAARYYARAGKAERAKERLPGVLTEARAEQARITALVEAVRAGRAGDEAVHDELGPAPPVVRGQVAGPALPYKTFRSSGGLEIRVGRGARHNDDLTFHHSSPGDVWMHARHSAGAHVVLRWSREGRPPARDLEEAATLAALHSKSRTSGSVPVDWTLRKYVRKPRRSPPGQVVIERVETIFVEPDEALLERLADSS